MAPGVGLGVFDIATGCRQREVTPHVFRRGGYREERISFIRRPSDIICDGASPDWLGHPRSGWIGVGDLVASLIIDDMIGGLSTCKNSMWKC